MPTRQWRLLVNTDALNQLHRLLREFESAVQAVERWGHYSSDKPKYERDRNAAIDKIVALFDRESR
jgi:hypothetical protein